MYRAPTCRARSSKLRPWRSLVRFFALVWMRPDRAGMEFELIDSAPSRNACYIARCRRMRLTSGTARSDPLLTFKIGPVNGREAQIAVIHTNIVANGSNRPEAGAKDRPDKRTISVRRRSQAEGEGCDRVVIPEVKVLRAASARQ